MDKKQKKRIENIIVGLIMLGMAFGNITLFWFFSMVHYVTDFDPMVKAFLFLAGLNVAYFIVFYTEFIRKSEGKN